MTFIWLAFFLSGIAGLSYELVWVRYVGHFVGASTPAISATVGIFLGGLALGSAAGGTFFQRRKDPFFAYALLELCIGFSACLVPWAFRWLEPLIAQWDFARDSMFISLALCMGILLPSTTLLGATFPAMAAVVRHRQQPIAATATFYSLNTLGGMAGCVLTSFVLLPWHGHAMTNWMMASINAAVFLLVLLYRRRIGASHHSSSHHHAARADQRSLPAPPDASPPPTTAPFPMVLAFLLAGTSGFFAISIEVLWTRSLSLCFPATVYVFAVVLAAYLLGIGLGALAVPFFCRQAQPHAPSRILFMLYLWTALGTLASLSLFPALSGLFYWTVQQRLILGWTGYMSGVALSTLGTMLPATFAMGAALPLLIGLAGQGSSRDAGQLYAVNVVGGVLGSLIATYLLLPQLGLTSALALCGLGYLFLSLVLMRTYFRGTLLARATTVLFVLTTSAMFLGILPEANPEKEPGPREKLLYYRDLPSASIGIYEQRSGVRSLRVNNFYGLNITEPATVEMQYRLGHLPLLLHGAPRRALLIGFATGNTLAAMAEHGLPELHCVELLEELYALADFFRAVNHGVQKNPAVRLITADGRRFVLHSGTPYDVIVGDLYLPRNPGEGALFSREHFSAVRHRLAPHGLFVAWLPLWQLSPDEVGAIIGTFLDIFPAATATFGNLVPERLVLGLLGTTTDEPPRPSRDLMPQLARRLRHSMDQAFGPARALSTHLPELRGLTTEQLRKWAHGHPRNTLEQPFIEYSSPRTFVTYQLRRASLSLLNDQYMEKRLKRSAGR